MKLGRAVAGVALGLVLASAAFGADAFWDTNGSGTGGGGTTAPGTWGVDSFWTSDSTGLTAPTNPWVAGDNAIFSAGTNVTGTYTVTVSGTQSLGTLTFQEGTVTLSGGELALNGGVITATSSPRISSVISGITGLNKLGAGTLTLSGNNIYSGTTLIGNAVTPATGAGIIVAAHNNALGTSDVNFAPGTTANAYTGRLYLSSGVTIGNNITLTNGSATSGGPGQLDNLSGENFVTGTITLAGAARNLGSGLVTIGAQAGTLHINGVIQNGGAFPAFAKVGPGTVILGGDSPNTYTDLTRVFGGYLIAEKDGAFGATTGGVFMIAPSGTANSTTNYQTVGFRAPASSPAGFDYASAESTTSISGFANDLLEEGLLHNFSGNNIYRTGSISLANPTQTFTLPSTIGASAGTSLTLTGAIVNSSATNWRNMTKVGAGTLILTGSSTNGGSVIVSNGTLSYAENGNWNPPGAIPLPGTVAQVSPNGTLKFDNSVGVNVNRFSTLITPNIDGGKFELVGNATQDVFQGPVGAGLNAVGDASFTVINPSSLLPETDPRFTTSLGLAALDPNPAVGGINRAGRGTMLLRGTALGTAATGVSQIFLDSSLNVPVGEAGGTGTKVGILPFATGDASGIASSATGFVTYGANGVRHLDEATEYAVGITSGSSDLVNATVSTPQAVLIDTAVNSVRMTTGGSAIVISDLASLSVNSGAILNAATDAASIRNGSLNFGAAEGVITTVGDLNITSVIKGSNGVTKSGRGTLTLGADNQFSGPLTINSGNVVFTSQPQLGPTPASPTPGTIVLNGGFLKPQGSQALDAARGITLGSLLTPDTRFTGSQYTGFDVAAGETLTVNGDIDGTGSITKKGAGTLVLAGGTNTYYGGLYLNEGVVSISKDSQLGTAPTPTSPSSFGVLTFNGGTLQVTEDVILDRMRGVWIGSRGATIEVAEGKTFDAQYYATGPGGMTKSGKGTLILGGAVATGSYFGSNRVTDGTLAYQTTLGLNYRPSALVADYWRISNGATLSVLYNSTANDFMGHSIRGITLEGAGKLDNPGGLLWVLNQPITGTGTLTKTGGGEIRLASTTNNYNGKTSILGGMLTIGADNRLGQVVNATDAITLDGGTLNANATFTLNANRGITLGANHGGLRTGSGFTLTYNGVISGAGNLTKSDVGTLVLGGTNPSTYTGTTTIEAGILRVNNSLTGGGDMTVNAGATLQGTGSILSNVIVPSSGKIAPGTTVGTLTMNALSLDTATLDIEGNATGLDRINVTVPDKFTLANTSTINLFDLGGVVGGNEYVIIDYAGAPLADLSGLTLSSPFIGTLPASLIHDTLNTQVKLRVAALPPPQWNVDADGSWGDGNNWSTFVEPNSASDTSNFLGKITAARTVTLDGAKTVNQVNFDNVNPYTLAPGAGGSLTVTGGGAGLSVVKGNHVISAPLTLTDDTPITVTNTADGLRLEGGLSIAAGKTLAKKSAGTLTINGPQTHGAGAKLDVGQGNVNLVSNAGTAATAATAAGANLAISLFNGGGASKIVLGSHQDVKEASVAYADADLQGLDLASPATPGAYNALRIYATDLDATKLAMSAAIRNAVTNAGDGVYDSGLAAHPSSAIGVAVITDAHGDKLTMVRTTRVGDLNLDGTVTISDFIDLASNFNVSGPGITWQEGDLNGDQQVSISDFIDLAANFNGTYAGSVGALSAGDVQTLASFASSIGVDPAVIGSAVPEPGTMSLLAIGGLGLMGRRRRR